MDEYFTRRQPPKPVDYEECYWATIVDPDGNVRDRLKEREKHLEDVQQELAFLNALPPGRILDIGCGLGFLLSGLKPEWEAHGVEVSSFAAKHASQWGKIFVGELQDAGYPDTYFDVVVMYHVIEHIADPAAELVEVRRVLAPRGVVALLTPNAACARLLGRSRWSGFRRSFEHLSYFSRKSLGALLTRAGFDPFFSQTLEFPAALPLALREAVGEAEGRVMVQAHPFGGAEAVDLAALIGPE